MGIIGDILAPAAEFIGAERTNKTNIKLARENREFQREMSNTAHQREVKDLIDAGLNPILSASKGGGGATTPQGNAPTVQNPLAGFANSAFSAMRIGSEIQKLKSDTNLSDKLAEEAEEKAETQASIRDTNTALQGKHNQDVLESKARTRKAEREIDKTVKEIDNITEQIKLTRSQAVISQLTQERERLFNKVFDVGNSMMELLSPDKKAQLKSLKKRQESFRKMKKKLKKRAVDPFNKNYPEGHKYKIDRLKEKIPFFK